jgi:hypothetical protein
VYQGKQKGFVLKLDCEKAHDKVNWDFLLDLLHKRDFESKWIEWIKCILHKGSVGVTVNIVEGSSF